MGTREANTTPVNLNEIQFGFMPEKRTVGAILIVRRMQEKYQEKYKKLYMCFIDMEKAFDKSAKKVIEWAMRKKGLSEVMVRAVMILYDGAKTRVRVNLHIQRNMNQKLVYIKDLCCRHDSLQ